MRNNTKSNLLISLLIVFTFSLRWGNCLPFSGNMPEIDNPDIVSIWGRYLIFSKESFNFPLGMIRGLSFPFEAANMARAFPLFALPLKLLARIFPSLGQFYYFPLAEIIGVFLTAYFTLLILDQFKVKFWPLKLLGGILTGLSPALLFRSSPYYGISIILWYFPAFLMFTYFYIVFYQKPQWRHSLQLALILFFSTLIDSYAFLGTTLIFFICLAMVFLNTFFNKSGINQKRLGRGLVAFFLGFFLSKLSFYFLGNEANLQVQPEVSLFTTRNRTNWGYGGGFGGGFHVADVLSLIIPPGGRWGPPAYLTQLGFPLTTKNLQEGQYEGFSYLGTVAIGLLMFLIAVKLFSLIKNFRIQLIKLKLGLKAKIFFKEQLFSLPAVLATAAFLLYILSWGYIIHLGGKRFNQLPTPALLISMFWRQFIFNRSPGRLALAFVLFVTIGTIIALGRFLQRYIISEQSQVNKNLIAFLMIFLSIIHIYEIKVYLQPPAKVVAGNEIVNIFGKEDRLLIKTITQDKKALMVMPQPRSGLDWEKLCYGLALWSSVPISGATIGPPGERAEHLDQYQKDIDDLRSGRIKEIVARYGKVAFAVKIEEVEAILSKSNLNLNYYSLENQKAAILTLAD